MSQSFIDAKTIKQYAQGKWLDIFHSIAPSLRPAVNRVGRHVPDPVAGGKDGFRLFRDAPYTGASYSNQRGALTDGFATLMYATGNDFKTILKAITSYLGLSHKIANPTLLHNKNPQAIKPHVYGPTKKEVIMRADRLNKLWRNSFKLDDSKATRAQRYLESRGIKKAYKEVGGFRFHPNAYYQNEVGNLCKAPAFIQAWQDSSGKPINLHRIFLSIKTDGKAEMDKPKLLMRPTTLMTGGAIRIGSPRNGCLSVSTGVETTLSVIEATGTPCWSCLSDSLLQGFIPPSEITHLTIWADNDLPDANGRNSGVAAAKNLALRLLSERPEIKTFIKIPPIPGKDWNDLLIENNIDEFFTQPITLKHTR